MLPIWVDTRTATPQPTAYGALYFQTQVPTVHNLNASGFVTQIRVSLLDPTYGLPFQFAGNSTILIELEMFYQ